jgi:two-component system response regulator YesN
MTEALRKYSDIKVFERGTDGWAFILLGENDEQMDALTRELCNLLIHICGGRVHYFGGIGRVVHRVRDIQQSYLDANSAFSMRYFESGDRFLSYKDVRYLKEQTGSRINVSELNLEKLDRNLLEEFLKRGTIQDVNEFVDSYFDGLGSNAMDSALFRQYIMMDGYSATMKFLKNLKYSKEKIDNSLKSMNGMIEQLTGPKDCREFYKSILKEAIDLRNKNSQKRYAGLIEKAKEYIDLKFAMSDLTLDMVASKVNVSPNYFSSLFNQETGMTFIEYLTNIRMEKAKEYLRCSNTKITEIGFLVGYLDSHYFSYIFKKTQNCTPSEYRLQGKGEE